MKNVGQPRQPSSVQSYHSQIDSIRILHGPRSGLQTYIAETVSSDYEMPGRDFEINIDTVTLKDGDGVDVVNGIILGNIDPRRLRDEGVPAP